MEELKSFLYAVYQAIAGLSFYQVLYLTFGCFAVVVAVAIVFCIVSSAVRASDKRPFLGFLNAYTAIVLSVFLSKIKIEKALLATSLFWLVGYVVYGVICGICATQRKGAVNSAVNYVSALPDLPKQEKPVFSQPKAQSGVRLDHAMSITEKLLLKSLSKQDRQELEKMKTTLSVLQIKGELTVQEGEILNSNFNALLKLMAKYNL